MSEISKLAKMLVSVLKEKDANKTSPYDTKATVKRIEGGTAWVHIPGGVDETPVQLTIDAKEGDSVQVRVGGGKAWLTGNNTAPPTDDAEAYKAQDAAKKADIKAGKAGDAAAEADKVAKEAKKIAGDTEQHFWFTETGSDTGAHITEIPQEEWEDSSSPNYHSGGNLLARSNGIAIREGMNELATFGASGVVIGQDANNKTRSELTASGMDIISKSNLGNDVQIAHFGYKSADRVPYFTFGSRLSGTIGSWSFTEGDSNIASGICSHSEGSGNESSGKYSHSEGLFTEASGDYSHASGEHIQATRRSQTVIGEWNDPDTGGTDGTTRGNFAFIIGNGSAGGGRSNAMTVDWNGGPEIYMDYNALGGGSDYPIYRMIKRLGWNSDVIDYPMLNVKELLLKILGQRDLIWTNLNPTNAFAAQDINCGVYDAYEIVFTGYASQPDIKLTTRLDASQSTLQYITGSTDALSGNAYLFKRNVWKTQAGVGFGDIYSAVPGVSNWARYTANTGCIPYQIYGLTLPIH